MITVTPGFDQMSDYAVLLSPFARVNMAAYKCYFLRGDNAPALQTFDCDQDGEAINHATALLDAKPEHYGIEIWKDSRLLARVAKGVATEQHHRT